MKRNKYDGKVIIEKRKAWLTIQIGKLINEHSELPTLAMKAKNQIKLGKYYNELKALGNS